MAREREMGANPFGVFIVLLMLGSIYLASLTVAHLETSTGVLLSLGIGLSILVLFNTHLAIYLLIFSMLLSPELALGGLQMSGAALGRGVTFRLDDFLLVIIGVAWMIKSAIYKELGIFKKTPLNLAMFFYISACALSTILGVGMGRVQFLTGALFLLKYLQYFVIFFLVINNVETEKTVRRYWGAVVVTAVVVGIFGLSQIPSGGRVTAPFEGENAEPNTFGGYLCLLILMNLALALSFHGFKWRLVYFGIASFLFIPFLFTLSRASYLALVPGLLVVLFLTRNRVLSYCILAAGLLILIFPGVLPQAVNERISFTWSQAESESQIRIFGSRVDTSTSARIGSFRSAIKAFPEEPIFGYGVTGWRFIDAQYFRTLLETGLVGLMALLFLIWRLFRLGLDRLNYFRDDPFYRGLAVGFIGGLVGLCVHAMGSNTFIIVRIMQPFWVIVGLLFVLPEVAGKESQEEEAAPLEQPA